MYLTRKKMSPNTKSVHELNFTYLTVYEIDKILGMNRRRKLES